MATATQITVMTEAILFHTDAPDIVLARDEFGAAYLCLLVRLDKEGHHFLVIQITNARVMELRQGKTDLRAAFVAPERQVYFRGHIAPGERLAIKLETLTDVP